MASRSSVAINTKKARALSAKAGAEASLRESMSEYQCGKTTRSAGTRKIYCGVSGHDLYVEKLMRKNYEAWCTLYAAGLISITWAEMQKKVYDEIARKVCVAKDHSYAAKARR